jgi:asparagine synthase (glutamine-hydrolysing)
MCGIVGVVSQDPIANRQVLKAGRDTMRHRGPDDAGLWWSSDGRAGLAHRRLAIIDRSPAGRQPMSDSLGTLTITFNGEIYNFSELRKELESCGHSFLSQTDTEVILAAYREWGTDCLARLNGMFAFGLYDSTKRVLFLARDRAGEKPLFYWYRNGTLTFASELKAIMADPHLDRSLDFVSLDHYLAFGYAPGERCIIKGLNKLPPAHAARFDLSSGGLIIWRYWQLPDSPPVETRAGSAHDQELVAELERLLEDSVRRQLVADVPVGILLSGGVDSSLITAVAARNCHRVKTFTISFPGQGAYDESRHARLVAEHFGTDHLELPASPATFDLLPSLAAQFDEPMVDSSMIPTYLVCNLIRRHCTVALGGDGGDELFGGYGHYSRLLMMQRAIGWVPKPLRAATAQVARRVLPVGLRGRNYMTGMGIDFGRGVPHIARLFDRTARRRVLRKEVIQDIVGEIRPEDCWDAHASAGTDLLDRAHRADFHLYLAEDILVKVDRASMLNSLETRAPLLDYRIIEFAFGRLPSRLKADTRRKKILAKILGKRLLPPAFDWDRKQGFSIPLAQWLRDEWRGSFASLLLDGTCPFFERPEIENLWRNHQRGLNNSERIFGLGLFELWRQAYKITC